MVANDPARKRSLAAPCQRILPATEALVRCSAGAPAITLKGRLGVAAPEDLHNLTLNAVESKNARLTCRR